MSDKPKKDLWLTPQQLNDHVKNMNEKAEKEYHDKFLKTLSAQVEDALSDSVKH